MMSTGGGGGAEGTQQSSSSSTTTYSSQTTGGVAPGGSLTVQIPGDGGAGATGAGGAGGSQAVTQQFSSLGLHGGGATQQNFSTSFSTSESSSHTTSTQQTLSPGALQGGMTPQQYAQQLVNMQSQKIMGQMAQQQHTQQLSVGSGGSGGAAVSGSGGQSVTLIGGGSATGATALTVAPGDASFSTYSVETPGGSATYASSSSTDTKEIPGGFATTSMQKSSYSSYSTSSS